MHLLLGWNYNNIQKSLCLPIFRNITETVKKVRAYKVLGCCHKITDGCMDL